MTGKKTFFAVAAALALLLVASLLLYRSLSENRNISIDGTPETAAPADIASEPQTDALPQTSTEPETDAAPDFSVLDAEGNTVRLSDRLGTPVVLNFWASWCGPCKNEMPGFDSAAAEYADKVEFMMVNLTDGSSETVESASEYVSSMGYSFPVYFDTLSEGAYAYGIRSIPTTFFIDAKGNIQAYYTGSMSEETLREGIALIVE